MHIPERAEWALAGGMLEGRRVTLQDRRGFEYNRYPCREDRVRDFEHAECIERSHRPKSDHPELSECEKESPQLEQKREEKATSELDGGMKN